MLLITVSFLLAVLGANGFVKGRIKLRRLSYASDIIPGMDAESESKKIKRTMIISALVMGAGGLGIFVVINQSNKSRVKTGRRNYKY